MRLNWKERTIKKERNDINIYREGLLVGFLVFYGISTLVGYFKQNHIYICVCVCACACVCVCVCGAFNKFPDFFVQAFKNVVDS